jgi:hypothetical protein
MLRLWELGNLVGDFEISIDLLVAGLIIWQLLRGLCLLVVEKVFTEPGMEYWGLARTLAGLVEDRLRGL